MNCQNEIRREVTWPSSKWVYLYPYRSSRVASVKTRCKRRWGRFPNVKGESDPLYRSAVRPSADHKSSPQLMDHNKTLKHTFYTLGFPSGAARPAEPEVASIPSPSHSFN
ncbi:hypothetical protein J6590_040489 [Homalodisca vitripennis]|nr:hypothetical protein J6590_040489 [Homalodisca vitripennis]